MATCPLSTTLECANTCYSTLHHSSTTSARVSHDHYYPYYELVAKCSILVREVVKTRHACLHSTQCKNTSFLNISILLKLRAVYSALEIPLLQEVVQVKPNHIPVMQALSQAPCLCGKPCSVNGSLGNQAGTGSTLRD